jgi:Tol biopolymer transport system component/DNA-binding winged helix-turn-helix (wHTH) protein
VRTTSAAVYAFDDVVVDAGRFVLTKGGAVCQIEPKSFRVLVHLIENRDRAVSKEELFDKVWQDAAVTDNALTRVIAQIRKALGDNTKDPLYVATIPTLGYRFIAELRADEPVEAPAEPVRPPSGRQPSWWIAVLLFATALGGAWYFTRRVPVSDSSSTALQFTTTAGYDSSPSLSPDGNTVAYSSDRSGRYEIYVRPLEPGARELQVTNDGRQNIHAAWSPDGRYIAYYSLAKGGIYVIPALGGPARQVTTYGSNPAWSPDGKRIAFQVDGAVALGLTDFVSRQTSIWVVPSDGGTPKQLTSTVAIPGSHVFPSWSPDGQRVLFTLALRRGRTQLYSIRADGSNARPEPVQARSFLQGMYAPDMRSIYAVALTANDFGIWRFPLDGGEPVEVIRTGQNVPRDLAMSANGKRMAYVASSMTSNLWSVPVDGASEPKPLMRETSFRNTLPTFSPDGRRIAFFNRRRGTEGDIWIMNADGSDPQPATIHPDVDFMPSWMPDSATVAYGSKRNGKLMVWTTSLTDRLDKPLVEMPEFTFPRVSPDGKELVFHLADANQVLNVYKMPVTGGKPQQLTFDPEMAGYAVWSYDGKQIAYEVKRGQSTYLHLIPASGGTPVQLNNDAGQTWPHSWAPDGDRIAFAGLRDGAWNVYWISSKTREQKRLTNYTSAASFVRYPAWSPKNDQIVYEYAEVSGNVYVVDLGR